MAASTTVIQIGCSPWSARCSDQVVVMKVRVAAIRRASLRMVSASMPGDARGPGRVLRLAVVLAHEVAAELLEADRVALEERRVVQPFRDQRVRQPEHDRGVGAGDRRQPFGLELVGLVGAHRADVDELDAAAGERRDRRDATHARRCRRSRSADSSAACRRTTRRAWCCSAMRVPGRAGAADRGASPSTCGVITEPAALE